MIDEGKISKQPPLASTENKVGPCPTIIQAWYDIVRYGIRASIETPEGVPIYSHVSVNDHDLDFDSKSVKKLLRSFLLQP